ncbi:DUF429 domain-containing protein [Nocardioides rotundus]|uniref:DUF429 domain-containing protein n=1 Tax=Nocardioides rotundus TaxID=1774216 RepID=UPI001CBDC2AE|nr:DUF429 domain-containing protein [Nocardioides rotundus]UAL31121.1 DUF429 domain-containing protein [Nocardioides rotundus]
MTVLGIDLAWSTRGRTGVAELDGAGRLVRVGTLRSDPELDTWIGDTEPAVVGIDAPIMVVDESGSRPCEKAIARAFGRFDAGPYPSNRGNPIFDPPRAWTLAGRHGWSVDPGSDVRSLALEVYPHAAMVGLFRLGRVIPYKARPQRALADRIAAFEVLCSQLESLPSLGLASSEEFADLRRAITVATRPVDLAIVEDQLDAIVCAYVAWLWQHDRPALRLYGDAATGFIVAPPAPDWPPSPR